MTNSEEERLQKVLSRLGVTSRRKAEDMIVEGRVSVNGKIVNSLGSKVVLGRDLIAVDGRELKDQPPERYIILNKPAGWICSLEDEKGRRTVIDLLDGVEERVYPVGRLDYATSGLLLLTNDGELMNGLLHPSHEVEKAYVAKISGTLEPGQLLKLRQGLELEDGLTAPAKAKVLKTDASGTLVEIIIHEGRNRQVRRMLQALGHTPLYLSRSRFGCLNLEGLPLSKWRYLTPAEVDKLKKLYK